MRIKLEIDGDLAEIMNDEKKAMGFALTAATRYAAEELRRNWRSQIKGAGLGQGLANSVRTMNFPRSGFAYEPATMVFSKASKIIQAFESGAVIRSGSGLWLAIPTAEAGRGRSKEKMTPAEWEQRNGRRLRMVAISPGKAFLVADDLQISRRGHLRPNNRRRRKDGILTGSVTAVIFILVPQVTLRKRLDLFAAASKAQAALVSGVLRFWQPG
jgi:hypothetical protein